MNAHMIERQFAKIGARASVRNDARRNADTGVRIDIGHDLEGEFFDIAVPRGSTSGLVVVDTQPRLRHLLLLSRQDDDKRKFLYRGIATRSFQRQFQLADYVRVAGAELKDGLLHIALIREIPEAMKPRRIEISNGDSRLLEGEVATSA